MIQLTQPIRRNHMSKILSIAAVALMVVGSTAFAGEGQKCNSEKKAECSAQKGDCSAKGECGSKKACGAKKGACPKSK